MKELFQLKNSYRLIMRLTSLHFSRKLLICTVPLLFTIKSWAEHRYDTIIIGAGVAGLTAAKQLHAAHQNVLIVEAKNRLGGRVYTSYDWGFATDWEPLGFMPLITTHYYH